MTVSRDDPRICRTPWPFVHLKLAEVIEHQALTNKRRFFPLSMVESRRLADLSARRVIPLLTREAANK